MKSKHTWVNTDGQGTGWKAKCFKCGVRREFRKIDGVNNKRVFILRDGTETFEQPICKDIYIEL